MLSSILGIIQKLLAAITIFMSAREREKDREAGRAQTALDQSQEALNAEQKINQALADANADIDSGDWNR